MINMTSPIKKDELAKLKAGDNILLSGIIYTARDAAHEKLYNMILENKKLPIDINGAVFYYCGPCPEKPSEIIGSAGPTTSSRMDKYTPLLLDNGLYAMIGKGKRSIEVTEAIKKNKCVYFGAIGGAGALIANCIKASEVVAFDELGCESVRKLTVENFPLTVLTDSSGEDLYDKR